MTRRIVGLLIGLVTALSLIVPPASAEVTAGEGAPLAHVRATFTTTSSWAILRIDHGWILETRTVTADNGTVSNNFAAVRIDRADPARPATATVELVVDTTQTRLHLANTDPVTVRLAKAGAGGTATVELTNLNDRSRPHAIATLHHPGPGSTPEQAVRIPATTFFTTVPVTLPRATSDTKVIAAYYPWFSNSGDPKLTAYDDPTLADRPVRERDLDVANDVRADVRLASDAGVDGFAVEFASSHRQEFALVARAAAKARTPFVVSGLLSANLAAKTPSPADTMLRWMRDLYAEAQAAGDVYHRTEDGRPIVWVWGTSAFTAQQWTWFRSLLAAEGLDFAIIHDGAPETYGALFEGHFRYGLKRHDPAEFSWWWARDAAYLRARSLLDGSVPPMLVTTVSPGHDDCAVRQPCTVIERDNGARYNDTWGRALAVDPDIVLVTSWNEWFEATSIAPSERFGSTALWLTWMWSSYLNRN